jgi:hypothetical protein
MPNPDLFKEDVEGAPSGVSEPGKEGGEGDQDQPSPFSSPKADELRAKIGRPKGARNRKSKDFERWFQAMGYKDPLQCLAEIITENPLVLQAYLAENAGVDSAGKRRPAPTIAEIVRLQIAAASDLAPYLHGKKPVEIAIIDERLPALILNLGTNQLDQAKRISADGALVIGTQPIIEQDGDGNKIKDLKPDKS